MKAELSSKISSYIFYILMAVTAVVLVMFYCVGYDNMSSVTGGAYVTDPEYTDLLMYWMYVLMAVGIVLVVVFGCTQFVANIKTDPKGAVKSVGAVVAMVALFVVAYAVSSDAPILINNTAFEDKNILVLADVCIYVQYVLLTISVVAAIISLVGVFGWFNKIKA